MSELVFFFFYHPCLNYNRMNVWKRESSPTDCHIQCALLRYEKTQILMNHSVFKID